MATENNNLVQALDRGLLVMETIAVDGPMTLNDIHKKLNLNKPSLSRLLSTLCDDGYLLQNDNDGTFKLSMKMFEIGVKAVRNVAYLSLVRENLAQLSSELNVVAQFSIEDKNELLCIESFDQSNATFSVYTNVGERSSLFSTSAGKAILSTYSNNEIREKWDNAHIVQLTSNTILNFDDLMRDISQTRSRNYALDMEENEPGLFCIGTVLMNYNRVPIGAISLSSHSMTKEEEKERSELLLQHAQRISYMLGYTM
ncbi:MAG: IclR family transcriptional regulator [Eubacteriaceae bacterium]|nr:IclR family transcriptional regulator [Eubacteriaceae bacterium]